MCENNNASSGMIFYMEVVEINNEGPISNNQI